jgi:hypothetical protein
MIGGPKRWIIWARPVEANATGDNVKPRRGPNIIDASLLLGIPEIEKYEDSASRAPPARLAVALL